MEHVLKYDQWVINESGITDDFWDSFGVSGALHLAADIAAGFADFIVPGSGAVIDAANVLSYLIEAEYVEEEEKLPLYVCAGVQAFVIVDPFNVFSKIIPFIKKIFKTLSSRVVNRSAIIPLMDHIVGLQTFLLKLQDGIKDVYEKFINTESFKACLQNLSNKLGLDDVYPWLKDIFLNKMPKYIKMALEILAKANPKRVGARAAGEGEIEEGLFKVVGKVAGSVAASNVAATNLTKKIQNTKKELSKPIKK